MTSEITIIETKSVIGAVNSYLVKGDVGFILVDTGFSMKRADLEKALAAAGCQPGGLKLIIITHGDFDHTGNGAYLRKKYGTRIAIHKDDAGMVERGDMFWNRKSASVLVKTIAGVLFFVLRLKPARFKPDIMLEDGGDLSGYGLDARVLHIPGHSSGSIGILTAGSDLFCGDIFENTREPRLNSIMDDLPTAEVSVEKLKSLKINTVYPGHGRPFQFDQLAKKHL